MIGEILIGFLLYPVLKGYLTMKELNGWDTSNVLNFLRTEAHSYKHPEYYPRYYVLSDTQVEYLEDKWPNVQFDQRPFDFVNKDEFSQNFPKTKL